MERENLTVGLFATSDGGIRLIERTSDPDLVELVRARILAARRADVARLEREGDAQRLRSVSSKEEPDDGG